MDWNVDFERALEEWIADLNPRDEQIDIVALGLESAQRSGPPGGSFHVSDDLYTVHIPGAGVRANFLAVMQDRKMIVKEFLATGL